MRVLLASADPCAVEAIDLFVFRVAREMAALATTMGGADGLVFTAGIGEKAAEIRRRICERLAWLRLSLDADANDRNLFEISASCSAIKAWVIPADEELIIARHTFSLLNCPSSTPGDLFWHKLRCFRGEPPMAYKTLLVHLDLNGDNEGLLKVTGDLAERFDAKVIGIAAAQPIQPLYDEGFAAADIATEHRNEVEKEIAACRTQFRKALELRV